MLWDEPKIFFLERRYFFSIILSEFLKNRVALHKFLADLFQCIEPKVVKPKQFLVIIRQSWKDLPEFVLPQKKECLLKGWIGWLVCEQTGHCVNFIPNEIQVTLVTSSLSTFP